MKSILMLVGLVVGCAFVPSAYAVSSCDGIYELTSGGFGFDVSVGEQTSVNRVDFIPVCDDSQCLDSGGYWRSRSIPAPRFECRWANGSPYLEGKLPFFGFFNGRWVEGEEFRCEIYRDYAWCVTGPRPEDGLRMTVRYR